MEAAEVKQLELQLFPWIFNKSLKQDTQGLGGNWFIQTEVKNRMALSL